MMWIVSCGDAEGMHMQSTPQIALETGVKRPEYVRLLRYMTVGASGTLLDVAALTLFKTAFGMPTLPANTLSFSLGLVNNYTWNRLWTFSDARRTSILKQFMQFAVVSVIGLLLNNFLVVLLESPLDAGLIALFGVGGYGYLPAKAIAAVVVFAWNFTANRYWTFNTVNRKGSES
jgi:putative flippase GtrA